MPPENSPATAVHLQQSAIGPLLRLAVLLRELNQKRKAKLAEQAAESTQITKMP